LRPGATRWNRRWPTRSCGRRTVPACHSSMRRRSRQICSGKARPWAQRRPLAGNRDLHRQGCTEVNSTCRSV
jgi:hypothetical protein